MSKGPCGLLLPSFWMGGYEGSDHVNAAGEALDMVRATGHLARLDEDYRRAARLGLRTLRESIGWRLSEGAGGALDLGRAVRMAQAARRAGIQPLWTLMHYGLPSDLSLFDDALIERFARFAGAVARTLRPLCEAPRFYTPINEISFLAWAASVGGFFQPAGGAPTQAEGAGSELSGYQIKRRLARAALAGMAAIRAVDPQARFLHVEPLVHVAAPPERPELDALARQVRDYQWQALDLLSGRLEPGLGGHEGALDWLGFNHYHSSQWEVTTEKRLAWHLREPRRQPLWALLQQAFQRYGRPLLVAETGHVGMGRAAWLHEMAGEALQARAQGLPLQGLCLYPLLDRPDWGDAERWHRCGLWQLAHDKAATPAMAADSRVTVQAYASALQAWTSLPGPPGHTASACWCCFRCTGRRWTLACNGCYAVCPASGRQAAPAPRPRPASRCCWSSRPARW
ncbi:family 1 glycosylhydrolase, partial [Mitsuaria sp. WAJ17]|uniref:family 1 glycosylhydrolase n=1 Tax=Mitsuaria sp. WAJ17 TaxID=2761452 RepID=UPI0016024024